MVVSRRTLALRDRKQSAFDGCKAKTSITCSITSRLWQRARCRIYNQKAENSATESWESAHREIASADARRPPCSSPYLITWLTEIDASDYFASTAYAFGGSAGSKSSRRRRPTAIFSHSPSLPFPFPTHHSGIGRGSATLVQQLSVCTANG